MLKYVAKIIKQPLLCIDNVHLVEFTNFKRFVPIITSSILFYTLLHLSFNIAYFYQKFDNEIDVLKQNR